MRVFTFHAEAIHSGQQGSDERDVTGATCARVESFNGTKSQVLAGLAQLRQQVMESRGESRIEVESAGCAGMRGNHLGLPALFR